MLYTILLSLLLAACGAGGANKVSAPLPTSSFSIPIPSPSPKAASGWALYENHSARTFGYTIRYQRTWQVKEENLFVSFSDTIDLYSFSVSPYADPDFGYGSTSDLVAAQGLATSEIRLFNTTAKNTRDVKIAKTVSVHGVTWVQAGKIGDVNVQGQVINEETVVMANHNPRQHLMYMLQFTAPTRLFITSDDAYFKYMVQSFTYATW